MKINLSDMSDSEYEIKAVAWKERNKVRLDDLEKEIKNIKKEFKHKEKPWWKKLLKI